MNQVIYPTPTITPLAQREQVQTPQRSKESLAWDGRTRHTKPRLVSGQPQKERHAYWVFDKQTGDYVPRSRPCDYCGTTVERAYLCDSCADGLVKLWEYRAGTCGTTMVTLAAFTNDPHCANTHRREKDHKKFDRSPAMTLKRMKEITTKKGLK